MSRIRRMVHPALLAFVLATSLFVLQGGGQAYAQPLDVTVETDKDNYLHGETMVVSGHVSCSVAGTKIAGATVVIEFVYPDGKVKQYPDPLSTDGDGRFVTDPDVPIRFGEEAPTGTYKIVAKASWSGRTGEGYTHVSLAIPEELEERQLLEIEISTLRGATVSRADRQAAIGDSIAINGYVKAHSAREAGVFEPVEGAQVKVQLVPPTTDWVGEMLERTDKNGRWYGFIPTSEMAQYECDGTWQVMVTASKEGFEDAVLYDEISVVRGALTVTLKTEVHREEWTRENKPAAPGDLVSISGEVGSQFRREDDVTVTVKVTDSKGSVHVFKRTVDESLYAFHVFLPGGDGKEEFLDRQYGGASAVADAEESGYLKRIPAVAGTWSIEVVAEKENYTSASESTTIEVSGPSTSLVVEMAVAAAVAAVLAAGFALYFIRRWSARREEKRTKKSAIDEIGRMIVDDRKGMVAPPPPGDYHFGVNRKGSEPPIEGSTEEKKSEERAPDDMLRPTDSLENRDANPSGDFESNP